MGEPVLEYSCPNCGQMKHAGLDDDSPRCWTCGQQMNAIGRTTLDD